MPETTVLFRNPIRRREPSFTLVELLVVMAIIAILAALVLVAGNGVMLKASRSRASAEIQAISAALEGYKTDNGIYPVYGSTSLETNTYASVDPSITGSASYYILSSEALYLALSGQTNFVDTPVGNKVYLSFKANQLGNASASGAAPGVGTSTYYQDPFKLPYGYNTGNVTGTITNAPYNGYGFFDLWSTGGVTLSKLTTTPSLTNAWISNWQ